MVFLAICLYFSLVSLFFALAARPANRSRRLLAAAIRTLFCCFASCRITASRSASAIFYFLKLRLEHSVCSRYAIADGNLQLCGGIPARICLESRQIRWAVTTEHVPC